MARKSNSRKTTGRKGGRRTARKTTNNPYPRDLPADQFEPARFDAQQQNPPRQQRPLPRDFMYIDDNMHYDPVSDTYREIPNPPPQQRNPPRQQRPRPRQQRPLPR